MITRAGTSAPTLSLSSVAMPAVWLLCPGWWEAAGSPESLLLCFGWISLILTSYCLFFKYLKSRVKKGHGESKWAFCAGLSTSTGVQGVWPSSAVLPDTSAGTWIRSRAAESGTHTGWWHCRQCYTCFFKLQNIVSKGLVPPLLWLADVFNLGSLLLSMLFVRISTLVFLPQF